MCFSATASFVTAGVAGAAGLAAVTRAHTRQELPLATIPLVFSVQQAVEGLLWLSLPAHPEGATTSLLTYVFLLFAKVVWPVLTPVAVVLIEPDSRRRQWIGWCCVAGLAAGGFFLWLHLAHPHSARIEGSHIAYSAEPYLPLLPSAMYVVATCAAPLLSTLPAVRWLGLVVSIGSLVTLVLYWEAFTSVWCFFAAAASGIIVFHFEKARQLRRALTPSA